MKPIPLRCVAREAIPATPTSFADMNILRMVDQVGMLQAAQILTGELIALNAVVCREESSQDGYANQSLTRQITGDDQMTDATFNATSNSWQCCGTDSSGNINCQDPLQEYFYAAPPQSLISTYSIPTSSNQLPTWEFKSTPVANVQTSSTIPVSVSASPTISTAPTISPAPSKGISSGAIAGIVVAVVVVAIAVGAIVICFLFRRRRRGRRAEERQTHNMQVMEPMKIPLAEVDGAQKPSEMPLIQNPPQELEGAGELGAHYPMEYAQRDAKINTRTDAEAYKKDYTKK